MRNAIVVLMFSIFLLPVEAQQVYKPAVGPFSKIEIYGSFDVELRKANKEGVKMESKTVDLTKIRCKVKGNTLKIKLVRELFNQEKQVNILIEYRNLESITVSNGASLMSKDLVTADKLNIIEGNGSKIDLSINAGNIVANIDKGATLNLEGKCGTFNLEASAGAICNGYELKCDSAIVKANAGGLIKINAIKFLDAAASTNADVSYRGTPVLKQKTVLGGTIQKVIE